MNKYIYSTIFIAMGIMNVIAYNLIGSYVDENGVLREPFFLIPFGYLFVFIGLILFIVWSTDKPQDASEAGKGALAGIGFYIGIYMII